MELSEAKNKAINIIYTLNEQIEEGDYHNCEYLESIQEEIDTIQALLEAIDNSISKDEVKKAIIDLEKIEKYENHKQEAHYAKICMKELLGEE